MKTFLYALLIALLFNINAKVNAFAVDWVYCTNCSDKFTQALDRVTNLEQLQNMVKAYDEYVTQTMQQIQMVQQNIEQYANMIQNTIQLPQQLIDKVTSDFQRIAQATQQLTTLRGDISALGQIHDALYLSQDGLKGLTSTAPAMVSEHNKALAQEWNKWSARVDEATQATFQLSGSQLEELQKNAGEFQNYVNELLRTPEGQQQALMAGNQLASLQIQEMRQLRELMATQIQSQLASQDKSEKESQLGVEKERAIFDMSDFKGLTPKDDPF